jgi:DNA repair photolyase
MKQDNMYPWVTKRRNYIGGNCPHQCVYCYVNRMKKRFQHLRNRYSGASFMLEEEISKNEGKGHVIFVQDCGDLFAEAVPDELVERVLGHCRAYPYNTYLFQTKNPVRFIQYRDAFPKLCILGATIESDINHPNISKAIPNKHRIFVMGLNILKGFDKMVSVEPVMDFNHERFVEVLKQIEPLFVSIGADSKRYGLKEPDKEKLLTFIEALRGFTEVRLKNNLQRILGKTEI